MECSTEPSGKAPLQKGKHLKTNQNKYLAGDWMNHLSIMG